MPNSKQLRASARAALKGKYWRAFLACLIADVFILFIGGYLSDLAAKISGIPQALPEGQLAADSLLSLGASVILMMAGAVSLVSFLCSLLLSSPAVVGLRSYFLKNTVEKPAIGQVFSGFRCNYGGNVKIMFLRAVKLTLWSMLLVIPGIIKGFEYAMIPYLLAEQPGISSKDAFRASKALMKGNKWKLFKLELSFIGWALLGLLTAGIGSFLLSPYLEAAMAEFYCAVKQQAEAC